MRKLIITLLFIISYVPLYLILAVKNVNEKLFEYDVFIGFKSLCMNNVVALVFLGMTLISILTYFILYLIVQKTSFENLKISNYQNNNEDHLSYLASYVLPFVGLSFNTWQEVVSSIILFYVLGIVYVKTTLFLINPTLTFFGFSISRAILVSDRNIILIHKSLLKKNTVIACIPIINNIYIEKNHDQRRTIREDSNTGF